MSATGSRSSIRAGRWPRARPRRSARTSTSRTHISAAAGAMSEPALMMGALEVHYAGVPAVRGIDLEVSAGEIIGLVGPNGAGKSSTLHAVMGVVEQAAGDVRVHGRSVRGLSPERVARLGVALVPEGRHIYPSLTVAENLQLGSAAPRGRGGPA